jgi:hypothetical protein
MYPHNLSITRSSSPLASHCISTRNSSKLSSYALVSLLALALVSLLALALVSLLALALVSLLALALVSLLALALISHLHRHQKSLTFVTTHNHNPHLSPSYLSYRH